jgi:hypothetical protein
MVYRVDTATKTWSLVPLDGTGATTRPNREINSLEISEDGKELMISTTRRASYERVQRPRGVPRRDARVDQHRPIREAARRARHHHPHRGVATGRLVRRPRRGGGHDEPLEDRDERRVAPTGRGEGSSWPQRDTEKALPVR